MCFHLVQIISNANGRSKFIGLESEVTLVDTENEQFCIERLLTIRELVGISKVSVDRVYNS